MTEPLREQIARLRELAPRLNTVTDQAAQLVMAVEKLLVEELSIGIPCRVLIRRLINDQDGCETTTFLEFDRHQGKFRLFVSEYNEHPGGNHTTSTLWAALPRDMKLASFQKIPALLADLSNMVEKAIKETEGASRTIMELVKAIGEPQVKESNKVNHKTIGERLAEKQRLISDRDPARAMGIMESLDHDIRQPVQSMEPTNAKISELILNEKDLALQLYNMISPDQRTLIRKKGGNK